MPAIRIVVDPITRNQESGARRVLGGRLVLYRYGDGDSLLQAEQEKPATLEFFGRYIYRVRDKTVGK